MTGDARDVGGLEFSQVFCLPDVAGFCSCGEADVAQLEDDGQGSVVAVEETNRFRPALQGLGPDFYRPHCRYTIPLLTQWILIDGDDLAVGKDLRGLRIHFGEIVARQQG